MKKKLDFVLLIPCYNNLAGLIESLNTVEYQNDSYLILVVDDGSTEPLNENQVSRQLKSWKPIFVLNCKENSGITIALNTGLDWIKENTISNYIARLDCGDLCMSSRFNEQVDFLNNHPETGLLGSWCQFIDEKTGLQYNYKTSTSHRRIVKEMYYRNVFMHATVMFRTDMLDKVGFYPLEFNYAEDYAFFWKMIKVNPSAVLDKYLVTCRVNRSGISYSNKRKQFIARWKVVQTFAPSSLRKVAAFVLLILLYFLPRKVALQLKKIRS